MTTDRFGNSNNAYHFNGSSDYIIATAEGLPASERTISFWFYANRVDNKPALFGYGGGACGSSWIHSINTTGSGLMSLAGHCGINDMGYSYSSAPIGAWHHWVITTSPTGTKMYLDNTLVQSNFNYVTNTNISDKDLIIGGCVAPNGKGTYTDGNVSFFDGSIDEIRIYNRELSVSEINELYNEVLPVELINFSSTILNNTIVLKWQTATELNNYGFYIEKKNLESPWHSIGFIKGSGTTNIPSEYSFVDITPMFGKNYYRLNQIDHNGKSALSQEIETPFEVIPLYFSLSQNYPNPFNASTFINFGLPEESNVVLDVYDIAGKEITTIVRKRLQAGFYSYNFYAENISSGIYFYRIMATSVNDKKKELFVTVKKLLLIK